MNETVTLSYNESQTMFMFNVNEALPSHTQPLLGIFTQVQANVIAEHILTL